MTKNDVRYLARIAELESTLEEWGDFISKSVSQGIAQEQEIERLRDALVKKDLEPIAQRVADLRAEVAEPECQFCRQPVKHLYEHWSTRNLEYYCNEFDRAPAIKVQPGATTSEEENAEYVSKEVDDIISLDDPWKPDI